MKYIILNDVIQSYISCYLTYRTCLENVIEHGLGELYKTYQNKFLNSLY